MAIAIPDSEHPDFLRLNQLRRQILDHDTLYYVHARPEITDAAYDSLYAELEELERRYPQWGNADSPTQRVGGAPLKAFLQVRHHPPMQSLDKTYDRADLIAFDDFLQKQITDTSWDYIVEPKVDGLSLSLIYTNGILTRAATRGNGEVGDDITANVRTIRTIPLTIQTDAPLIEIRGEIYMSRTGFAELNRREEEAGHEPFANPRNAAAGSIKLLDPRQVARRPLDALLYASGALKGIAFDTHSEMMRTFSAWGFKIAPWSKLCLSMTDVMVALDELEALRHAFDFEMDGAVIKVNQRNLYAALGATAHAPRFARAYKYAPEHVQTKLLDITIQVGRTGVLTPVAELQPVFLAGSTIARATLHNADYIQAKDIRIGDTIWLAKAGDVIPAIEASIPEQRTGEERLFTMPEMCPVCQAQTIQLEKEVALRCSNPGCPAQRIGRLQHFVSRNTLDINAIGGRMAEALVESGLVQDPLDLFSLTAETLQSFTLINDDGTMRKFGRKSVDVIQSLHAAQSLPLHRWIQALGIPSIGETASRSIAPLFQSIQDFFQSPIPERLTRLYALLAIKKSECTDYAQIIGEVCLIGDELVAMGAASKDPSESLPPTFNCVIKPEMARSLTTFLASDYAHKTAKRLEELEINPEPQAVIIHDATLTGLSFVITGTLSQPRNHVEALIREQGGILQNAVSKKTSYLITGEDPGGSKYTKAEKIGVPFLSEAAFMAMIESSNEADIVETKDETKEEETTLPNTPQKPSYTAPIQDDLFSSEAPPIPKPAPQPSKPKSHEATYTQELLF